MATLFILFLGLFLFIRDSITNISNKVSQRKNNKQIQKQIENNTKTQEPLQFNEILTFEELLDDDEK